LDALSDREDREDRTEVSAPAGLSGDERELATEKTEHSIEEIREGLRAVDELKTLLEEGNKLPLRDCPWVFQTLSRAERGGLLEGRELIEVSVAAAIVSEAKEFLTKHSDALETLSTWVALRKHYTELSRDLAKAFDEQGELRDDASPSLFAARARLRSLHGAARRRAESLLDDPTWAPCLMDRFVTLRDDHYVLPVRVAHRRQVPGRVFNVSASSKTAFIEPNELASMSDDLAVAISEEKQATREVLEKLTQLVGRSSADLREDLRDIARLDLFHAKAALARDMRAGLPLLAPCGGELQIRGLRHPLLCLEAGPAVPCSYELGLGQSLMVTGPNAGGKTVTVTATAMAALMVHAGLLPPLSSDSLLPIYRRVEVVLGDEQDMKRGLSSFSAHLAALVALLPQSGPECLIVIDEIAQGTDPDEGAALASVFLKSLTERDSTLLITTHLTKLRELGATSPRFRLAALEISDEGIPSYQLLPGSVGKSDALAAALRAGFPTQMIDEARALLRGDLGPAGQALEELRLAQTSAHRAEARAEEAQRRATEASAALELAKTQVEEEKARLREEGRDQLLAEIEAARVTVATMIASLQANNSLRQADATARHLKDLQARELAAGLRKSSIEPSVQGLPEAGDSVRLPHLGNQIGSLLELEGKQALVLFGGLKTRVPLEQLVRVGTDHQQQARSERDRLRRSRETQADDAPPSFTLDLRGLRAEVAISRLEQHLDSLLSKGEERAKIIHGHGTGALKKAVRAYLKAAPHVLRFEAEDEQGGGDGVTLVEL